MANERELSLKITGDSSKAERAVANLERALQKAEKELAKAQATTEKVDDSVEGLGGKSEKAGSLLSILGDRAGGAAKEKLGPMGDALEKVGIDLDKVGAGGMVAAAGLGAGLKFVADGVGKFNDLTEEVRQFKAASGESWESSSRFVAIADDIGISADTAAGGVNKLAKAAAGGELEKFGLEAVRAKDGTIDMGATLAVVADAMNNEHDQAKKAAMGTALLGKSWVELDPLLKLGSAGIKDAMSGVKGYQIVTEETAAKQRAMALAMDDMHDSVDGLQMSLAKELIPQITTSATRVSQLVDAINSATGRLGGMTGAVAALGGPFGAMSAHLGDLGRGFKDLTGQSHDTEASTVSVSQVFHDAAAKAAAMGAAEQKAADYSAALARSTKDLTEQAKGAAEALKAEKQRLDEANQTLMTVAGTQIAYENAAASLASSIDGVSEAHAAMDDAVNTYGADSKEAKKATEDYNASVREAKGAADAQAQAAANLAEKTALAAGETFTAEQKSIVYRDALNKVRDASNDPALKTGLDGLVGLVDAASESAGRGASQFDALAVASANAATAAARAVGIDTGTTSADAAERRLTPQAATTVNITAYGADARDLGQLVNQQLLNQRMERGG